MAVKTEKASEVKTLTATPTDSDKVLGYNSTNGAGFWTLSNFLNWIKNKTRSTIAAGDKTPVNSDAVNSALANYGINVNKTLITFSDSTKYKINNADNSWYRVVHNVCYFNISIYCSTTDKSSVDVATLTNAKPTNLQYFIACKTNGTEHLQVNINTDGVINIANGQVTGVYNLSGCYLVA